MEENIETCNCVEIHKDIVESVKNNIPMEDTLNRLSELFKALGDMTRIKIIYVLFQKEMCVCDIAETLEMTQSAISHQLRVLKSARLVKFRKDGKVVYYSLDDDHVKYIFDKALMHVNE
ncbi:ArsR/SmtB family transcription factor [Clostridium ihumii]|uniref:ArsR/SmtB family transcription factor n=1 Tax=Clostridium ihumii TaxID=1470356 RepID=UPI00054E09BB|nr:metalloregulator ArsR/SmtB family transcription factor [Clostridium ihumii]